ncbi:uncharacterized protein EAF02_009289 [Botrytis sinoallii]|uniref:uncharacterized protein n=1 Tax=Botrytis sinoallii TaxID=1463999 RepID=UPI001902AD27|nr:uncharacterized protein EAF02_009289 [Botrytis sinoallii]KAF7870099.1 hypothetical protein EAF02_009289 [Botrytis sinoallii]
MRATTYLALATTGVLFTVYLYKKLSEHLTITDLERNNGCMPPRKYPHKDPLLGLDFFFKMGAAMKAGKVLQTNRELYAKYGKTFQSNSWGTSAIHTCESENIKTVLALSFGCFGKVKVKPEKRGGSLEAQGTFTADGKIWQRSRALIRPTFARTEISNFGALEKHVARFLELLPCDNSTSLDISTEFLFGESVESQSPNTPFDALEFLNAFDMTMRGLGARMMLGKLRFIRGRDVEWKKAFGKVHAYIDKHISRVLEGQKSAENNEEEDKSATQKQYILLNEMAKETQDPVDLRYQLFHVFIPAHDATGIAVSDIFFHLARDAHRWDKLRGEVLAATTGQTLSFEILKSMKYLRYVFDESLRLHPTAGFLRRVCHKDTILPLGGGPDGKAPFLIKEGSNITCDIYALHRDKSYWGNDADDFRPERWETLRPTWEYLPFSGGPRICPAQQMVFIDSAYIIVRVMQKFSKIESRDSRPWMERFRMAVENGNGVRIRLLQD